MEVLEVSERRVCRVIGQPRATQRYPKRIDEDEGGTRAYTLLPDTQAVSYGITDPLRGQVFGIKDIQL
jgi:hypothetical protein